MKGKSGANEGQTRARVKAPARIPLPLPLPLPLHKTFIGLVDLWKRLVPGGPRPTKTTGQGKLLSARLNQHGPEQVQLVILWACYGLHKRALFLRESGAPSLTTLMRPANFESYATMAAQDMHVDDGLFDRWRVFAEAGKRPVPGSPDEPNQTSVLHPASRRVADSEEDQEELRRRFAQRAEKLAAKEEEE